MSSEMILGDVSVIGDGSRDGFVEAATINLSCFYNLIFSGADM